MKKICVILCALLMCSPLAMAQSVDIIFAVGSPYFIVNGEERLVDNSNALVRPYIKEERTMVPLRVLSEAMACYVGFDDETQTISIEGETAIVIISAGNPEIMVNGEAVALDVAPEIIEGRTFVPLRAISDAFGMDVFYNRGIIKVCERDTGYLSDEDALHYRTQLPDRTAHRPSNSLYWVFGDTAMDEKFQDITGDHYDNFYNCISIYKRTYEEWFQTVEGFVFGETNTNSGIISFTHDGSEFYAAYNRYGTIHYFTNLPSNPMPGQIKLWIEWQQYANFLLNK